MQNLEYGETTYLARLKTMMDKNNHIEAGPDPKGIWLKDFVPMKDRGSVELKQFIPKIKALVKSRKINLLDVASGNGARSIPLGIHLAKFGEVNLKLVDMQEDAISRARMLSEAVELPKRLKLELQVARIADLLVDENSLDGITFVNGLHFIEPTESIASLKILSRGLRPDGLMSGSVCSIFNAACVGQNAHDKLQKVLKETLDGKINTPYESIHRRYGNMYFYTENSVEKMLDAGGFKLIVQKSVPNRDYPNGLDLKYRENIDFVAAKI